MDKLAGTLKSWFSPSGVVVIIGFVVWLIQLNQWVLNLKEDVVALDATNKSQIEVVQHLNENQVRVTATLEGLVRNIDRHTILIDKIQDRLLASSR